ncbi:MAG: hypothetical protein K2G93_01275, partial [Rikenella sp.]|nr:hypothetical protein [Rikenella sp.]
CGFFGANSSIRVPSGTSPSLGVAPGWHREIVKEFARPTRSKIAFPVGEEKAEVGIEPQHPLRSLALNLILMAYES